MKKQRGFLAYAALGASIVIIGLSIALSIQTSRLKAVKQEYEAFKTQVRLVGEAQEARTQAEIKRQKEVTKNVEKDYVNRLAALRADYARLRDSRSRGGDLSRLGAAAPATSACTREDVARLLDRVEEGVLGILEKGDSELAKFHELWKRDVQISSGMIK